MQRFKDRVVLVTGASSGIGKAAALRLAEEGASVCCVDLNQEGVEATAAEISAAGGHALALTCDVSDEEQVNACIADCVQQLGSLYSLINMAGILRFERFHETSSDSWQQIQNINLNGTFYMCRAALPHLKNSKGNIVNAASTAALTGLHWGVAYSASKGAVLAMTRSIAVEYAKDGVRANCVCPGDIKTPMTKGTAMPDMPTQEQLTRISSLNGPLGPEVVAGVIAMLASEDAVHVTGEDVRVDGGTLS